MLPPVATFPVLAAGSLALAIADAVIDPAHWRMAERSAMVTVQFRGEPGAIFIAARSAWVRGDAA